MWEPYSSRYAYDKARAMYRTHWGRFMADIDATEPGMFVVRVYDAITHKNVVAGRPVRSRRIADAMAVVEQIRTGPLCVSRI